MIPFITLPKIPNGFYIYSVDTRKEFLETFKYIKDRIVFASQSIIEFHNNRITNIKRQQQEFQRIRKNISSSTTKIKRANDEALSSFQDIKSLFKKFPLDYTFQEEENLLEEYQKKIIEKLEEAQEFLPNYMNDEILNTLSELFLQRANESFSNDEIKEFEEEGEKRYKAKIPPGYTDNDKDENKYGDLIIWKEMIAIAKRESKPLIFITDERKEDLWEMNEKLLLFPRLELIKEFYLETKQFFWIYSSDNFLKKIARSNNKTEEEELKKAIREISETQEIHRLVGEFISVWNTFESRLRLMIYSDEDITQKVKSRYNNLQHIPIHFIAEQLHYKELLDLRDVQEILSLRQFRNKLVHNDIAPTIEELNMLIYRLNELCENLKIDEDKDEGFSTKSS
ncbi:PIN-like domain-containing protein [Pseudanabaena mucicola]|uniref:PIN-like domain-containing protein n=1 Tax=Pseudanabaena mucicola TaxID=71190 RepID=UPI001F554147|nr:PIN-like domain-containing protein [Pseudanabaena mucicola]